MKAIVATFIAVLLALIPTAVEPAIVTFEQKEIRCIAKGIYHEARAESLEGQKAVGYVILNRSDSGKFPNTACEVLYQRKQFSNIRASKIDDWKTYQKVYNVAKIVYHNPEFDNTKNALYFHGTKINPKWSRQMIKTVRYGGHVFLRPRNG
jgi:N-acetylmuramoyl-L-alanine amidase